MLIIDVKGIKICARQSLITFKCILSVPGAFADSMARIISFTSSDVTVWNVNWSARGKLLETKGDRFKSLLNALAKEWISLTAFCPTEQKKSLKSLATIFSSFVKGLTPVVFLRMHERIVFHKQLESFGLSFICLATFLIFV